MVGAWFSPGTPASSTTKTGRHDIAEILLKVALSTKNQIKSNQILIVANTNVDSLVVGLKLIVVFFGKMYRKGILI
jgi:hypothetical protein